MPAVHSIQSPLSAPAEFARIRALRRYDVLDTPPEKTFDDLARLAATIAQAPIAAISFIDASRQWFKARIRYYAPEQSREGSICLQTIAQKGVLEIPDATQDAHFADHPLVGGGPSIVFYAGVPLLTPDGQAIGTLCVMDRLPRALTKEQKEALQVVAHQVMTHLEFRRQRTEAERSRAEHERTDAALRESEERFQSFMQNSPAVAFMKDEEGRFLYVNRWFERVFDVSLDELRGQLAVPYFAASFNEAMQRTDLEVLAQNKPLESIERVPNLAGEVREWLTLRFPIEDRSGKRYLGGMAVDVTEQRQATNAALASARAKAQFLANMSHEIRTPMNGIIGMADLLLETKLTARQQDFARTIQNSAEALTTIINDVLDFSKNDAGKLRLETLEFDPRTVLDGVVEMMTGRAVKKGIDLIGHTPATVPARLLGDPGRLRQVLANLVGNAVKFTDTGEVMLDVDFEELQPGRALLRFRVIDTGIGISPEQREELFRPFHQADGSTTRKYGGTGLGLAICKQIVQQMGGEIGFTSTLGHGATFWFTALMDLPADAVLPVPALGSGERALVLTPGRLLRRAVAETLEGDGIFVEHVEDFAHLRTRLRSWAGEFLVADFAALEMEKLELPSMIKGLPRVIALRSLNDVEFTGSPAHPLSWVEKPFRSAELWRRLRETAPEPGVEPIPEVAPPASALRVLVVEDNLVNQKVVSTLLINYGCTVTVVDDGQAAVEKVQAGPFDAILMDCQMPVLDGYEATRAIRKLEGAARHTWIIAITAHSLEGDREKCLDAGMDDFVTKPLRRQDLEMVLERRTRAIEQPLDTEVLAPLQELSGSSSFGELTQLLVASGENCVARARAAWIAGDDRELELAMHTLKGSASNFGARRWSELCGRLEAKVRHGRHPGDVFLLDAIEYEYGVVTQALAQA